MVIWAWTFFPLNGKCFLLCNINYNILSQYSKPRCSRDAFQIEGNFKAVQSTCLKIHQVGPVAVNWLFIPEVVLKQKPL
jgi:hypothetical protein